jgi:branched-chain amino acid transport system substrate-binding protein
MLSADSAQAEAYLPACQTRYEGVTGTIAFDSQGELQSPRVTLYGYDSGERKELVISGH